MMSLPLSRWQMKSPPRIEQTKIPLVFIAVLVMHLWKRGTFSSVVVAVQIICHTCVVTRNCSSLCRMPCSEHPKLYCPRHL
ncbi:hypothetical protein S7711_10776, partial [Stachybotrys chartarum IBT 7711]